MKRLAGLVVAFTVSGLFAAACGTKAPNPLGSGGSGSAGDTTAGPTTTAGPGATTTTGSGSGCKPGGASCALAQDCCSKVCDQGTCTPPTDCKPDLSACGPDTICCSGSCTNGLCGGGGDCDPNATCAQATSDASVVAKLCGQKLQYYVDFHQCACVGACADACSDIVLCGGDMSPFSGCAKCLSDSEMGCDTQLQNCMNN